MVANFITTVSGGASLPQLRRHLCQSAILGDVVQEINFQALHFVVLPVSLRDEYTWCLKRPTGYEYGYLLDKPITYQAQARHLVTRLGRAYGTRGLLTDWAGLPGDGTRSNHGKISSAEIITVPGPGD